MSDTLGMSLDYLSWDNTEAVRVESARKGATAPDVIPVAKRRAVNKRELAASGGAYTGLDAVWILPAALLPPAFQFKPGDAVIEPGEGGARWTVLEAQLGKARNTWRLTCRDPIVAYDLQDLIDVQTASASQDAAGVTVRTWAVSVKGVPCRVQEMTRETKDERGIRGNQTAYTVFLSRQLAIDTREMRVAWNGLTLDILTVRNAERIDELPQLDCVAKP